MNRITIIVVALVAIALVGVTYASFFYDDQLEGDTAVTTPDTTPSPQPTQ